MRVKANPHVISDQDVADIATLLADAMGSYGENGTTPAHAIRIAVLISDLETQAKSVTKVVTPAGAHLYVDLTPKTVVPVGYGITKEQIQAAKVPKAPDPLAFSTRL